MQRRNVINLLPEISHRKYLACIHLFCIGLPHFGLTSIVNMYFQITRLISRHKHNLN